jgi:FtsP/CotA-like multicopper oxidase with cupredoxin domain
MDRRKFLRLAGTGAIFSGSGLGPLMSACRGLSTEVGPGELLERLPLRLPPMMDMRNLTLTARRANALIAPGVTSSVWTLGENAGSGATLEVTRGERVRVQLLNQLDEPTIVHWHGFRPPEAVDGHPRFAVDPGESFSYDFQVDEPAGLYWYHPHPHMRTAVQTYMGMAGLILVRDPAEEALGLPTGARELPLLLSDKRLDGSGAIVYNAFGPDMMEGFLGDVAFVNGVRSPTLDVDSAVYRLRLLNASNARIFRVARSDGRPLTLIGTDGGFLPAPIQVPHVDLGTGERVDLLADFSDLPVGTRLGLVSLGFPSPSRGGGMGMMRGVTPQGASMELMEIRVARRVTETFTVPAALPAPALPSRSEAERERTFRFESMMMNHTINGRAFQMDRIDERVPLGSTEVWTFVNDSQFPHPVHMHAVHFRVLSRTGGRGQLFPWEAGAKDTVLLFPDERVEVVSRFDRHPGRFLLHCHNLEHEDMGMMMNFQIE